MADSDWQAYTAPFRQALSTLDQPAFLLHALGADAAFDRLFDSLTRLPAAATFQAFGVTGQWQVDLARPEHGISQTAPSEHTSFTRRLSQRARRREQLVLVPGERNTVPSGSTAQDRRRQPAAATTQESQQTRAEADTSGVAPGLRARRSGAWAALAHIAELVGQLQHAPHSASSTSGGAANGRGDSATAADAPRHLTSRHSRTAPVTAQRTASEAAAPQARSRAAHTRSTATDPQRHASGQPRTEDGLDQLARHVAGLWPALGATANPAVQDTASSAAASGRAVPEAAPRAPSLLQADTPLAVSVNSGPDGESVRDTGGSGAGISTGARAPSASGDSPREQPVEGDEDAEQRINRALIEQAWLRGVDLT